MINFFSVDIHGVLLYANINDPQLRDGLVVGRNFWSEHPEEVGGAFYEACLGVLNDQKSATLEIYHPADQTWWENQIYPISGGLAVYCRNISSRKQTEEDLGISQANLYATINNTEVLMWSLDRELKFLSTNKALLNHIEKNRTPASPNNQTSRDGLGWHAPDEDAWRTRYERVLAGESLRFEDALSGLNFQISMQPILKGRSIIGVAALANSIQPHATLALELQEAQKKINTLKLTAWRSAIDAHFIFGTLNSIQHYIIENDQESAINYLASFAKLIRGVRDSTISDTTRLGAELELVRNYVSLEQMRNADKFDFRFTHGADVDLNMIIPPMIIKPFLENAIAHRLRTNREKKGTLALSVKNELDQVIIKIEDNGSGAEPAADHHGREMSVSAMITAERLRLMNSEESISVSITDNVENGEARGKTVILSIPYGPE